MTEEQYTWIRDLLIATEVDLYYRVHTDAAKCGLCGADVAKSVWAAHDDQCPITKIRLAVDKLREAKYGR